MLVGLLGSLSWAGYSMRTARAIARPGPPSGWIPIIAVAGLAVAVYLSVVELTGASAVCGPIGDCNLVHQSDYARLFGLLPVGVLGCAGYGSVLGGRFIGRLATGRRARLARYGLFALTVAGTIFSVYLTFVEPFVLGATCGWCLASALLMDAALLVATTSMWGSRASRPSPTT